jgi:hypothetical protein
MNRTKITALGDSLTKGVILTDKNKYTLADKSYLDIVGKELDMNINTVANIKTHALSIGLAVNF